MNPRIAILLLLGFTAVFAEEPGPKAGPVRRESPPNGEVERERGPGADARAGRPGPWDNDVLVQAIAPDGSTRQMVTFERAGVPTIARLADGRLIAAHQHFPADFGPDFDKVAVHFSEDEGQTWSTPRVIEVAGLPEDMRFPFDPTLVPLPDGQVRLYFTANRRRGGPGSFPAVGSAISRDGLHYDFELGTRFAVEGRIVIDCAVVLHRGVFHLYSPDNGDGHGTAARDGFGYHATSTDGLTFTRAEDVRVEGRRHWLGGAVSDGTKITFYGTGPGVWAATSEDGATWALAASPAVRGADPGVVSARDGGLIIVATGPPRRR